jgi:hypothetical protein
MFFKLSALGVLSGCIWFFGGRALTQTPPPQLTIEQQPESPLVVTPTSTDFTDPYRPKYRYQITNTSDKTVRAYAIRREISFGADQPKQIGVMFAHMPSLSLLLRPNQFKQTEQDDAVLSNPAKEIILSVDFVEFDDGTTWGDDSFMSSDRLAGQRAGGKEAIRRFKEIFRTGGLDALTTIIDKSDTVLPENQTNSQTWQEGFREGVGITRHRLKEAKKKGGLAAVQTELDMPFDSAEGRQEK